MRYFAACCWKIAWNSSQAKCFKGGRKRRFFRGLKEKKNKEKFLKVQNFEDKFLKATQKKLTSLQLATSLAQRILKSIFTEVIQRKRKSFFSKPGFLTSKYSFVFLASTATLCHARKTTRNKEMANTLRILQEITKIKI